MSDTWMLIQNLSDMCITTHFINSEWTLHKLIVGFKKIKDHKDSSIGNDLDNCIKDYRFEKFYMTFDNVSANNISIDWFK